MTFGVLRKTGHTPTLVASVVYFDFSFMVWVLLGALGAYIAADLGLAPFQLGIVVAIPPLGGSIFRLVFGAAADRFGARRTGILAASLTLIPLAWGWLFADDLIQLSAIGLLLGIAGASFAVAIPLVSRWYPPESQGIALGITGAGNSGTVLAALLAPRLAEVVGWHGVFGLAAFPILIAIALLIWIAKEPPNAKSASGSERAGILTSPKLLRIPDARWLSVFYAATFGGFVGFVSYLPLFLVDSFGISKVRAGSLAAACGLAGSLVRPVGGFLADRVGGATLLAVVFSTVAALALLMTSNPVPGIAIPIVGLMLGALGIGNGAVFQLVPQRFGSNVGAATGLIGAAGGLGGFMLPVLMGFSRSSIGAYSLAFGIWSVICGLIGFSSIYRRRVWMRDWGVEVAI